jgi:hypothetical protein
MCNRPSDTPCSGAEWSHGIAFGAPVVPLLNNTAVGFDDGITTG